MQNVISPRVLLIDDEQDIREIVEVSLELVAGWDVVTVSSGAEGLERAAVEQFDLILLDVKLPDMDGPAIYSRLRSVAPTRHIPVLFITASVQATERRRLEGLGANGILTKPFDPLQLASDISRHLGW
jgi:CheY-like chemotaxis protein